MAAEVEASKAFSMSLELEHGPLSLPDVVTAEVARLGSQAEVVLALVVPTRTLDVLVHLLVQFVLDRAFGLAHVDHVDTAIIATREEYLFILAIPLDYLDLVGVEVLVGHFAGKFVNIPDPHSAIGR